MQQKVWLITGVSKGLGRQMAQQAAATGDIVIGTVRKAEDKKEFEQDIHAQAHLIDLSNTDQIAPLVGRIIQQYGRIDVLINNAGYGAFGMIEEFNEKEIMEQLKVNFLAVWKLCQSVLPHMRAQGRGTIVQISSRLGLTAGTGNGMYAAGKFALEGMSESLQQEVKPFGIRVLLVEPGAVRTDFFGNSVRYAQNEIQAYVQKWGNLRANTKNRHGKQSGDPAKAARVIIDAVNSDTSSFRLPLTSGTITAMRTKVAELQDSIATMGQIALSVERQTR